MKCQGSDRQVSQLAFSVSLLYPNFTYYSIVLGQLCWVMGFEVGRAENLGKNEGFVGVEREYVNMG